MTSSSLSVSSAHQGVTSSAASQQTLTQSTITIFPGMHCLANVISDLWNAISRKRCKIGAKLILITNRKSHMIFRLVPNSVTLDDLERRNSPNGRVISPNSVAFGADYVKWVEDIPELSAAEM